MSIIYDMILFLFACPTILWRLWMQGKYRHSKKERFGFRLPDINVCTYDPVIWIHSVSVGETRAVIPLYQQMRKEMPHAQFVISNTTETGHEEAKRSMPDAQLHFILPLDFSWTMRRLVKRLKPDVLVLVEGDYWYHLLRAVKSQLGKVVLVNGKISERSTRRFALIPFLADKLFGMIDLYCVQNEKYARHFSILGVPPSKIVVTGNMKLDAKQVLLSPEECAAFREELGIGKDDPVVVIGSTGAKEEELLLVPLMELWQKHPRLKVILAPRHPERFSQVLALLQQQRLSVLTYTKRTHRTGHEHVILIDTMGQLLRCYQIATVAVVGGSFIDNVGGHNIFEPVQCSKPVLFGPYMFSQSDLLKIVLDAKAGKQVTLQDLASTLAEFLEHPEMYKAYQHNARQLLQEVTGATQRTWAALQKLVC